MERCKQPSLRKTFNTQKYALKRQGIPCRRGTRALVQLLTHVFEEIKCGPGICVEPSNLKAGCALAPEWQLYHLQSLLKVIVLFSMCWIHG